MGLFVCEGCRHVENTALTRFWLREREPDPRALCSLCRMGRWHGLFQRVEYDGTQVVQWVDGKWVNGGTS